MADISFIQDINTNFPIQDLADNTGGFLVVGSQRLAERVMLELLTESGSIEYQPTRGTPFLTLIKTQTLTEVDVLTYFCASRPVLQVNLQQEETNTDSPTERYVDSTVTQLIIVDGAIQITLGITSRAGLTTVVTLPTLIFT